MCICTLKCVYLHNATTDSIAVCTHSNRADEIHIIAHGCYPKKYWITEIYLLFYVYIEMCRVHIIKLICSTFYFFYMHSVFNFNLIVCGVHIIN